MKFKIVLLFLFSFAIGNFTDVQGLTTKIYGNVQDFPYIGRALAMSGAASNCTLITTRFPDVNFNVFFYLFSNEEYKFMAFVLLGRSYLRQACDPWH